MSTCKIYSVVQNVRAESKSRLCELRLKGGIGHRKHLLVVWLRPSTRSAQQDKLHKMVETALSTDWWVADVNLPNTGRFDGM